MAWICLDAVDCSGKSTVAEMFEKKGYKIVHLSAPNKKYYNQNYSGPSYFEEMVELLSSHIGHDVVWDRTFLGEIIWSKVYQRPCLLEDEDVEYLRAIEDQNDAVRYTLADTDIEAHWQRCQKRKENLTRQQFNMAQKLYDGFVVNYGFTKTTMQELLDTETKIDNTYSTVVNETKTVIGAKSTFTDSIGDQHSLEQVFSCQKTPEQEKLDTANAINSVLSRRLIKQKGNVFDQLELDVKNFLNSKLAILLGTQAPEILTPKEVKTLKLLCQKLNKE